jgi:methylmalonyl-CoA mutase cobalamin-binding domain/chain
MDQSTLDTEPRHPVAVVCRRTGLKPDRLRAWERRYEVVQPARSEGNQRLYSDADIERLALLQTATTSGHRIAGIASLTVAELRELLRRDQPAPVPTTVGPRVRQSAATGVQTCLAAIQQLDEKGLRRALSHWAGELAGPALAEELLAPLVHQVGQLWADGGLQPTHEHLATSVLTRFIGDLRDSHPTEEKSPTILVSTMRGQRHDLGALLVAETAAAAGWKTIYLGSDLPSAGIAAAARQTGVDVVALSFVYPADDPHIPAELDKLRDHLGEDVEIIAGGAAAADYGVALANIAAIRVEGLAGLRRYLVASGDAAASQT